MTSVHLPHLLLPEVMSAFDLPTPVPVSIARLDISGVVLCVVRVALRDGIHATRDQKLSFQNNHLVFSNQCQRKAHCEVDIDDFPGPLPEILGSFTCTPRAVSMQVDPNRNLINLHQQLQNG